MVSGALVGQWWHGMHFSDGGEQGRHREIRGQAVPQRCEYRLTYTAIRSWDVSPYLSDASARLFKGGQQIGFGHYHLTGQGGLDPTKVAPLEQKMALVINQLLGQDQ